MSGGLEGIPTGLGVLNSRLPQAPADRLFTTRCFFYYKTSRLFSPERPARPNIATLQEKSMQPPVLHLPRTSAIILRGPTTAPGRRRHRAGHLRVAFAASSIVLSGTDTGPRLLRPSSTIVCQSSIIAPARDEQPNASESLAQRLPTHPKNCVDSASTRHGATALGWLWATRFV